LASSQRALKSLSQLRLIIRVSVIIKPPLPGDGISWSFINRLSLLLDEWEGKWKMNEESREDEEYLVFYDATDLTLASALEDYFQIAINLKLSVSRPTRWLRLSLKRVTQTSNDLRESAGN
jgi:hypothetical protein